MPRLQALHYQVLEETPQVLEETHMSGASGSRERRMDVFLQEGFVRNDLGEFSFLR